MPETMHNTAYRFVFDQNKCVACHACVVACSIENATELPQLWRQISTSNPRALPGLAVLNFSMACNHCHTAACMHNCPALAYERHPITGAVLLNTEHCIGCQYCTWVCPYDAPKYNVAKGYTEKCTFCNHRILEGNKPACASLCPTGALGFESNDGPLNYHAAGFGDYGLEPSLRLVPLRSAYQHGPAAQAQVAEEASEWVHPPLKVAPKISARKEWPLVLFTLGLPLLWAWFVGSNEPWHWAAKGVFVAALAGLGVLSAMHLGQPLRAWRAVLNLRRSWLSREIVAFGLFAAGASAYLLFYTVPVLWAFSLVFGAFSLLSVDMVYAQIFPRQRLFFNSSSSVVNGLFFLSLLLHWPYLLFAIVSYKVGIFIVRNTGAERAKLSAVRLLIFAFVLGTFFLRQNELALLLALATEGIGRALFYNKLLVITPQQELFYLDTAQTEH